MTRDEFLGKTWKSYPRVLQQRDEFLFGRVVKLEDQSAWVKRDNIITTIEWGDLEFSEDDVWGPSCPLEVLRLGDAIAYKEVQPAIGVFYLLSPNISQESLRNSKMDMWPRYIRLVEDYFLEKNFHKARTPCLVKCPGVDHHIDFLKVEASQTKRTWTLPTSPEISLKKLICQGQDKIFEIKTCFRDDLPGPHHSVEFEMLEWYRCYEPMQSLVEDLSQLLLRIKTLFPEVLKEFQGEISTTTVREQFKIQLGFTLTPETTKAELFQLAEKQKLSPQDDDEWNTLFFRIFMDKIETNLGLNSPQVIFDFPASQASLAQIDSQGWAQRFELYWGGVELANAYCEVNDPKENQKRFLKEKTLRKSEAKESLLDEDFIEKMQMAMPPCSGIALGLERLFNLLSSSK